MGSDRVVRSDSYTAGRLKSHENRSGDGNAAGGSARSLVSNPTHNLPSGSPGCLARGRERGGARSSEYNGADYR